MKMSPNIAHTLLIGLCFVYLLVICHYACNARFTFYNQDDNVELSNAVNDWRGTISHPGNMGYPSSDTERHVPRNVNDQPDEKSLPEKQKIVDEGFNGVETNNEVNFLKEQNIANKGRTFEGNPPRHTRDSSRGIRSSSSRVKRLSTGDDEVNTRGVSLNEQEEKLFAFLALVKNAGTESDYCQKKDQTTVWNHHELILTKQFYKSFSGNASAAVYTANLLSSFYSRQRANNSVFYNVNCIYASIRNNVENYPAVSGSCVAFDRHKFSRKRELFAPCAHFDNTGVLIEQDLGKIYNYTSSSSVHYTEWFTKFKSTLVQPADVRWGHLIPRLNATTNGEPMNTSYVFVEESVGSWGPPYFDCNRTSRWLVTYSIPFFDHEFNFMGVVTVDVDLRTIDINQCDDGGGVFAGTHECSNTTQCVHISGKGFQSGSYKCVCRAGYYFPDKTLEKGYFQGTDVERDGASLDCLPCNEGCDTCVDHSPCFLENDILLRILILGVQGMCIFMTGALIAVIFKYKNLKVINCDSPWMLVVVLLGGLLLYSELVAMFFHPSVVVCFMQRWLRGWGFAIAYGMLVLKIYRKLAIFQTRSATRVLVRDRDVLKWLVLIVVVLSGYLAAWTAFSVQNVKNCKVDVVDIRTAEDGMKFSVCLMEWWDYVIEIIEFLFLLFGIYLCYSVRAAPSEFHETRYISIAIYNETIFSSFLYVSRHFVWGKVAPDWIYLTYFLRSQLTTTVMLALIFIPKIKVIHKLLHDESFRERVNSRVVYDGKWHNSFRRPNSSSSNLNNDHNFSPEDVREELKRLYTQLEVYKTKSLRIDNPHLPSKKKSGVSKWRAPRRFSRGYSLRTHSGHSESERSSEIARSNESLGKAVELHDYRVNHVDPTDQSHCSSQKWLCQQ